MLYKLYTNFYIWSNYIMSSMLSNEKIETIYKTVCDSEYHNLGRLEARDGDFLILNLSKLKPTTVLFIIPQNAIVSITCYMFLRINCSSTISSHTVHKSTVHPSLQKPRIRPQKTN